MNTATGESMATTSQAMGSEPFRLLKRIGSTVYTVSIHFSEGDNEKLEDKVIRLIEREVSDIA